MAARHLLPRAVCVLFPVEHGALLFVRESLRPAVVLLPVLTAWAVQRLLDELLSDRVQREQLGRAGQRRVFKEFLIFTQLRRWLEVLADVAAR